MTLARCYCYVFYQIQTFFGKIPNAWPVEGSADVKSIKGAISFMDVLVSMWIFSLLFYIRLFVAFELPFNAWIIAIVIMALINGVNFYVFRFKNKWMTHSNEFAQWPMKKNRMGGWIVFAIICLSAINLVIAYKLNEYNNFLFG